MSWFLGLQRQEEAPQFISLLYVWEAISTCSPPLPLHRGTRHRDGKARPKCTNNSMSQGPKSATGIRIQFLLSFWEPSAIRKNSSAFFSLFLKKIQTRISHYLQFHHACRPLPPHPEQAVQPRPLALQPHKLVHYASTTGLGEVEWG